MAATLEKRWNESLIFLGKLQTQYNQYALDNKHNSLLARKNELLELAKDFPRLWHSKSTTHKDRKRILRLLIKDIALKISDDRKTAQLYIR